MVATWRLALLPLLLAAAPLRAQSEAQLKQYFEGKRVTLRIAMPGTEEGVDIYPGTEKPLDYPRYADRLKDNGTAITAGTDAMITKVRVKSKHVEFHLDGGGYGTMSDETSSSVHVQSAPKSNREKNLEAELKREQDPVKRRAIKEELDDLRREREREDSRNRAEVADAVEQKKENIRQWRLQGGSRFNVRYRDALPEAVITPKGLEAALEEYVTFPTLPVNVAESNQTEAGQTGVIGAGVGAGGGFLQKGMTAKEVAAVIGEPVQSSERQEGTLTVVTHIYRLVAGQATAEFVEDVLIRYSMTSN